MNNNCDNSGHNNGTQAVATVGALDSIPASDSTAIHIDTVARPQRPTLNPELNSTRISINMEGSEDGTSSRRSVQRNFLSLFSEARSQLGRQSSYPPGNSMLQQRAAAEQPLLFNNAIDGVANRSSADIYAQTDAPFASTPPIGGGGTHPRHIRSWRMNLNDVLSFSSAPSTEALRSLITHSGNFRYTPLSTSDPPTSVINDNLHLLYQEPHAVHAETSTSGFRVNSRTSRSNSLRDEPVSGNHNVAHSTLSSPGVGTSSTSLQDSLSTAFNRQHGDDATVAATRQPPAPGSNSNAAPQAPEAAAGPLPADMDEDNNVISDMFVKVLGHFVRYLPFICILFVKFIHDHLLGILDLLLLHGIMYQVNKSLREQIAKFSQKSYGILLRDFSLVAFVVAYRFVLAASLPDPLGLLIAPSSESVTIEVSSISKGGAAVTEQSSVSEVLSSYLSQLTAKPQPSAASADPLGNTVTITKAISLGVLLYYVAVNDLILKLITILVKISITMMPTKVIRHKPRARMYVLVEYLSQFYRALAPVRQWLIFLFESYTGLEVISGILFSSFYMGAKGFEFVERGKSLKKAIVNFVRNMDYERKPTKDELDAAGSLCPICHDAYSTPVVLECGHIFCDDCVSTWFKREQTCPMCRAKVSEDPTWQDGSTTFFYQLC